MSNPELDLDLSRLRVDPSSPSSPLPGSYLDPEGELQRLLGPGHQVVKIEKEESRREAVFCASTADAPVDGGAAAAAAAAAASSPSSSSVLLVNGRPVGLDGEEGGRIRECLLRGVIPDQDLINHLLMKAGLILRPRLSHLVTTDLQVSRVTTTASRIVSAEGRGDTVEHSASHVEHSSHAANRTTLVNGLTVRDAAGAGGGGGGSNSGGETKKTFVEHLDQALDSQWEESGEEEEDVDFNLLLWSRWHLPPGDLARRLRRRRPDHRLARFVRRWVKWFPSDFAEEGTLREARLLCRPPLQVGPHLLSTLASHLAVLERHVGFLQEEPRDPGEERDDDIDGAAPFPRQLPSLCPLETARELTRIELDYLTFLGPEELLNSLGSDDRVKNERRLRNLDAYTEWFNHLTYLVATTVCRAKKKKCRVRTVRHWIEVARQCINIGNFNSLMGVITGLNMAPVSRLTKTWEAVHSEKFSVLEHQMDPASNFSSYRSTLTAAIARSEAATDDRARAVIPFFSLFYKDLFVAKEKYLRESRDGPERIFALRAAAALSASVREFNRRKEVNCPYRRNPRVAAFLRQPGVLRSEARLDLESYGREPPKNAVERRRMKEMKKEDKRRRKEEEESSKS